VQPPLAPRAAASLEHRLAAAAQMASEASAVVAGTLNRPDTRTRRVLVREAQRLRVAPSVCRDRALRDNRADRHRDNREYVPVPVRVHADHVIHLVCKHPL